MNTRLNTNLLSIFRLLFLAGLTGYLMSCASLRQKEDTGSLRFLALNGPSALSMVFMMDSMTRHDSLPVSFEVFSEPKLIRSRLLQEEADIAMVPTNLAAIVYNLGLPYRLLMVPVWGTLYLCGTDSTIRALTDLKGQHLYSMARGMNPDIVFRSLLSENGLDPDRDVFIDYAFPSHIDLANAVLAGRADPAVLSEPQISLIKQQDPDIRILIDLNAEWESTYGIPLPQTAVLVHEDLLTQFPAKISKLVQLMIWSAEKVNSEPALAARLAVEKALFQNAAALEQSIPQSHIRPVLYPELKHPMKIFMEVFYTFNPESIGGKIPDENFFVQH